MFNRIRATLFFVVFAVVASFFVGGCGGKKEQTPSASAQSAISAVVSSATELPQYTGAPYTVLNNNNPYLSVDDAKRGDFEEYSELDSLGRCGVAYANVSPALMPTEKRGRIGMVKPSGWHTVRYDDIVEGKYLYNRCHLIGYQLI